MKLKDIIPSAIMLEGSEFNELVMTDLGRAKFDTIYGFKGSFKYGEQDLTKVLDIMKKSVETDKYIINARGFIAGLSCEFTGEIMIGVKKQSNPDYAGKNIKLSGTGCGTIEQYNGQSPSAEVKYIGVKCGNHSVAVTLHDIPGDEDGELPLLPDTDKCPKDSPHYCWDRNTDTYRFNTHEDFDGKGNTERLKSYGCQIPLNEGEWVPSVGELAIICMNLTKVNEALEKAGGDKLLKWTWASTENSSSHAWSVDFGSGYFDNNHKYISAVVRAVAAFI